MISTIGINSGNTLASRVGKMVEFMGNQCVRDLIIKKKTWSNEIVYFTALMKI